MRWVYLNEGHEEKWTVLKLPNGGFLVTEKPLEDNPKVKLLRTLSRKYCALIGKRATSTIALTPALVISIFKQFVGTPIDGFIDRRDLACLSIIVQGMSMGLRYDELKKLDVAFITIDMLEHMLSIASVTKNRVQTKNFSHTAWPTDTFTAFEAMCPFLALLLWFLVRGPTPGPLFCDIVGEDIGQRLVYSRPWPTNKYCAHIRKRAALCGWGEYDASRLTGHSPNRSGTQLFRALSVSDEDIMENFNMTSIVAYIRYTELNNRGAEELPRFTNSQAFISHARKLEEDKNIAEADADESDGEDSN
eukprot:Plantae.Rhodophyta-Palmaria_palmata.ctg7311.p1 GENE.Plantae.Rhodophyta-Palmaria_palmata.ctg7311~~Plantae.Rhodophyta-Palmaria_palmata.ctg7311.p1  ORF type:complete len:305 (+),score=34.52 Plantae.Rhodophyta-Palmaria_palmata.ctg7311:55-969(+)